MQGGSRALGIQDTPHPTATNLGGKNRTKLSTNVKGQNYIETKCTKQLYISREFGPSLICCITAFIFLNCGLIFTYNYFICNTQNTCFWHISSYPELQTDCCHTPYATVLEDVRAYSCVYYLKK